MFSFLLLGDPPEDVAMKAFSSVSCVLTSSFLFWL